ncbi:hypothetical protein IVB30_05165 [Bradyrhizobium sp. 200]|uniref:hypothetical protein n=1 Tax=Bradyrhizobium sp. 200 TaxID=2782665 RepID=UPI001FFFAFDC|nr:hypothetical protein [Bradyrhizobium sp. 200]UPJ50794.1 hypothetical protein IVB30_05165 [Bradyrhizobium sp. 200]
MSQIFKAFFAVFAIFATFGAVQLASGHDLTGLRQLASTAPASDINRAAKTDRGVLRAAQSQTETITIRNVGLDDTSVVVRVPVVAEEVRNRPAVPAKPKASKTAIACEPPVSVLTEIAKLLQPGRCIT